MRIYESGKYVDVHPTFLYELIVTLFIFIFLTVRGEKRKFEGENTYLYLIIYSFGRIFIEGIRTDSLMLGPVRISQMLSIIIFGVFLIMYNVKCRMHNNG